MSSIIPKSEPFYYHRGPESCLLIHGFTGSPGEMRPLGAYLAGRNFSVRAPLLPGHGTSPREMTNITSHDWLNAVYKEIEFMLERYGQTTLIGLSMGALLSLLGSLKYPLKNVVSMAAPVYMNRLIILTPIASKFNIYIPKGKHDAFVEERGAYRFIPTKSLPELLKLRDMVVENINKVTCPVLILQGKKDTTVNLKSAFFLKENIKGSKIYIFPLSGHILTMDKDKNKVFKTVEKFIITS